MMKSFGLIAAVISVIVFAGVENQTAAAEAVACSKKIQGQLIIEGPPGECLPSEICFGMADYENALRFRIGIYHLGDDYYTLSGIEYTQDLRPGALSGSAVEIDDSLLMTFTVVQTGPDDSKDPYVESKMGKITLDLTTSKVNLAIIDVKAYEDGSEHIGDSYDALSYIECPQ